MSKSSLRWSKYTFLIFVLNGALDTGQYDDITLSEAKEHVRARNVFKWLEDTIEHVDLGLYKPEDRDEISTMLIDAAEGVDGREMRKLWVEHRGLCYLIGLVTDALQRHLDPSE